MTKKQRNIIITLLVLLILVPIVWFIIHLTQQQATNKQEQPLIGTDYVDPVSGETVTKSAREHDGGNKDITVLGTAQLFDIGFSFDQYTQLEDAFEKLRLKYSENITQISLYKNSATTEQVNGDWGYVVKAQINEKHDHVFVITYESLSSITLNVYDKDQKKSLYTVKGDA